jgi:exonuclease SbcC
MKINSLKLRGAIGIRKGLGKEEIELNFRDLAPGLVAISGKNGTGKTTIIENLHPYRCMVSRDGSLSGQFYLKDSYRTLEFEYNGKQYESKILIDALTGASEAYLFEDCKALNDGKLTTYDIEIDKLLGSRELFFNSVFSGQKSKGIAQLKPAEIKTLFFELLNLNHYEIYCEKAKEKMKAKQLELSGLEGEIRVLQETVTEFNEADIMLCKETLQYLEESIITNGNDLSNAQKRKEELGIALSKAEDSKRLNIQIESQISDKQKQIVEICEKYKTEAKALAEASRKELVECGSFASQSKIAEIDNAIQRNVKLQSNLAMIVSKIGEKTVLELKIKEIEENLSFTIQAGRNVQQELYRLRAKINAPIGTIVDLENKLFANTYQTEKRNKDLEKAKSDYRLINEVPCDELTGMNCQFLKNAHEMKDIIPIIENELLTLDFEKQDFERRKNEVIEIRDSIQKEINSFSEIEKITLNDEGRIREESSKVREDLALVNLHPWEQYKQDAVKAESDNKVLEMQKEAFLKEAENIEREKEQIIAKYSALEQEKQRSMHETVERLELDIQTIKGDLISDVDNLIYGLVDEVNNLLFRINILKSDSILLRNRVSDHQTKLKEMEIKIEASRQNQAKINAKITEKILCETEIKDYSFLVKAFDKTGIPVLKLENSGIEISYRANELLSLFENKFRIVFETTSWTKDKKKLKETFLINVVEDDGVCNLSDKSGGQQVWLETAIQLAISLVVRQQGRRIETSFLDEKDGALDIDNAYSYVQMLRRAHEMSGVHNTFIITHRQELLDMIPQKVMLKDGFLQVINN